MGGYQTPITGGVNTACRKRPMAMPSEENIEAKNPVSFLNEIRGATEYILLGTRGSGHDTVFTMGVNIDGVAYSGSGPNKKDAKRNCKRNFGKSVQHQGLRESSSYCHGFLRQSWSFVRIV